MRILAEVRRSFYNQFHEFSETKSTIGRKYRWPKFDHLIFTIIIVHSNALLPALSCLFKGNSQQIGATSPVSSYSNKKIKKG